MDSQFNHSGIRTGILISFKNHLQTYKLSHIEKKSWQNWSVAKKRKEMQSGYYSLFWHRNPFRLSTHLSWTDIFSRLFALELIGRKKKTILNISQHSKDQSIMHINKVGLSDQVQYNHYTKNERAFSYIHKKLLKILDRELEL